MRAASAANGRFFGVTRLRRSPMSAAVAKQKNRGRVASRPVRRANRGGGIEFGIPLESFSEVASRNPPPGGVFGMTGPPSSWRVAKWRLAKEARQRPSDADLRLPQGRRRHGCGRVVGQEGLRAWQPAIGCGAVPQRLSLVQFKKKPLVNDGRCRRVHTTPSRSAGPHLCAHTGCPGPRSPSPR